MTAQNRPATERHLFAHEAVVAMEGASDARSPGGAVTLALCGDWDHEPPCPLAPHHTAAVAEGEVLRLRVLFAAAPGDEAEVRRRIDEALAGGEGPTPDGVTSRWRLLSSVPSVVRPDEREYGGKLAGS